MKSILLLQIEDRINEDLHKNMNENKQICLENNIKYIFLEKSLFNIPPYWAKLFEINKLMNEYPDIEYIMWLDSDAFFVNYDNTRFQNFLKKYENYSMIFTKDMPPWDYGEFNAGSFIIKNNSIGQDIVKTWMSYYDPKQWTYDGNKWKNKTQWAGVEYEQGAFIKYIMKDPKFNKSIIQLPYYYLNNNNCETYISETITTHLANYYKHNKNILQKCFKLFKTYIYQSNEPTIEITEPENNNIIILLLVLLICLLLLLMILILNIKKS